MTAEDSFKGNVSKTEFIQACFQVGIAKGCACGRADCGMKEPLVLIGVSPPGTGPIPNPGKAYALDPDQALQVALSILRVLGHEVETVHATPVVKQ